MRSMRYLTLVFVFLALPGFAQERRDGNWWLQQSDTAKNYYVIGFFDGTQTGREFSQWNCVNEKDYDCIGKANRSFLFYSKKYLDGVNSQQLADGLDAFYKDYRNRKILIHSGVWLTLNSMAGTPREELDRLIENHRANAMVDEKPQ